MGNRYGCDDKDCEFWRNFGSTKYDICQSCKTFKGTHSGGHPHAHLSCCAYVAAPHAQQLKRKSRFRLRRVDYCANCGAKWEEHLSDSEDKPNTSQCKNWVSEAVANAA